MIGRRSKEVFGLGGFVILVALASEAIDRASSYINAPLAVPPSPPAVVQSRESSHNLEIALSPLERRLLANKALLEYVDSLPSDTSVAFKTFSPRIGIVIPQEGLLVRNLPTITAKQASPYGWGHKQRILYVGEIITAQKNKESGITYSESWAIIDSNDGSFAYAQIGSDTTTSDGKPTSYTMKQYIAKTGTNTEPLIQLRSRSAEYR